MSEPTVIDATAEEIPGTELAPSKPPPALFKTDDPVEVIEKATAVANALKEVLRKQGLVQRIRDKDHVKVEGWTTLGAMLGVNAVCVATVALEDGFKATVEARMADGRVVGRADAVCSRSERYGPWKTAEDYALLSMAQTRATSKALRVPLGFVVALAGYNPTPAEEMASDAAQRPAGTAAAQRTGDDRLLSKAGYAKVIKAIEEAGKAPELVFSAVNLDSPDGLTVGKAKEIRKLLDGLAQAREDVGA